MEKIYGLKIIDPFTSDGEATSIITNASIQFKQIQDMSLEWQDHRGGGYPSKFTYNNI